jgi:hypothetical protein
LSVAAPFVWRYPNTRTITPFPHPAHRTALADHPHPALGQNITPSPMSWLRPRAVRRTRLKYPYRCESG